MRLFVGYGYNTRDQWIEDQVFPILRALGMEISHGKDMHGEVLQAGVKQRIVQADALVGFCTLREGQETAAFNTHPWVRDELVFAEAHSPPKPIVEVREEGVTVPAGILGNRQWIPLRQADRLSCVCELVSAVRRWSVKTLQLVCADERLQRRLQQQRRNPAFSVRYRTRLAGVDSGFSDATLEEVKGGLYITAAGLPDEALIEVVGTVQGQIAFGSGWESVDAVQITIT